MSLSIYLESKPTDKTELSSESLFYINITHNLRAMADAAGLYDALWQPETIGATQAKDIAKILRKGLNRLIQHPNNYLLLESRNGWGKYNDFLSVISQYAAACYRFPDSYIDISI